jgi:hypothetical protein
MTTPAVPAPPAVPVIGDISLRFVQSIEHDLDSGFSATRIVGLDGGLQQRSGRASHCVRIRGLFIGDAASDDLGSLQKAAGAGAEVTFSADITTALDLQKVVITHFRALAAAGTPNRYSYELEVAESPPLPPPAQTSAFGGLGDFGLGDLGLDAGVLDSVSALADQAGAVSDLASSALGQVASLAGGLLAGIGDLGAPSGLLQPLSGAVGSVRQGAESIASAASSFSGVIG